MASFSLGDIAGGGLDGAALGAPVAGEWVAVGPLEAATAV
jgi:hypothetical protein